MAIAARRSARPRVAASRASRSSGAGYGPDRAVGDTGVKRRGVKLGMAQQCLDHANIDILLEEVRGKAVPQRVRRHALGDPRGLGGAADNAAELPGRQRLD